MRGNLISQEVNNEASSLQKLLEIYSEAISLQTLPLNMVNREENIQILLFV